MTLNTTNDGALTTSLGSLIQGLTIKIFFLMHNPKHSKSIRERENYPSFDVVQDMGWLSGLHVHIASSCSIFVHPYSQVLLPRATFNPTVPQFVLILGII